MTHETIIKEDQTKATSMKPSVATAMDRAGSGKLNSWDKCIFCLTAA